MSEQRKLSRSQGFCLLRQSILKKVFLSAVAVVFLYIVSHPKTFTTFEQICLKAASAKPSDPDSVSLKTSLSFMRAGFYSILHTFQLLYNRHQMVWNESNISSIWNGMEGHWPNLLVQYHRYPNLRPSEPYARVQITVRTIRKQENFMEPTNVYLNLCQPRHITQKFWVVTAIMDEKNDDEPSIVIRKAIKNSLLRFVSRMVNVRVHSRNKIFKKKRKIQ